MDDVVSLLELPFSLSSFDEGTGLNFHTWSFVDFVLSDNISNFIFCRPHKSFSRVQDNNKRREFRTLEISSSALPLTSLN